MVVSKMDRNDRARRNGAQYRNSKTFDTGLCREGEPGDFTFVFDSCGLLSSEGNDGRHSDHRRRDDGYRENDFHEREARFERNRPFSGHTRS